MFDSVFTDTCSWAPILCRVNPVQTLTPGMIGITSCSHLPTELFHEFLTCQMHTQNSRMQSEEASKMTALLPDETHLHIVRNKLALKYGLIL